MIFVKLQGRLGNQMFQYAFAYSTVKKNNTNYYLIESEFHFRYSLHYFKVRRFEKLLVKLATSWYFRFNKKDECKEYDKNKTIYYDEIPIENNVVYNGFFQTDLFFREEKNRIKKIFEVKDHYKKKFLEKYNILLHGSKSIIVIHYRGGDYKNWGGINYTLPSIYYKKSLQLISDYSKYKIVIVTDDIILARSTFEIFLDAQYISDTEINDFQLLLYADKLIISNSTFAWWGAYLNYNNAEVFAPKYWLGFNEQNENPKGIMSVNWNWIEF